MVADLSTEGNVMSGSKQKSVVVYGPKGCGKTTNRERIRQALKLDRVLEADILTMRPRSKRVVPEHGVLLLAEFPTLADDHGLRKMTYTQAMQDVVAAGL